MAIIGITFDNQSVTAKYDGMLNKYRLSDGFIGNGRVTFSGTDVFLSSGFAVIAGRLFRLSSTETVGTTPQYADGYARIKGVIDLTGASTTDTFSQVYFSVDYSETDSWPSLVQEDVNGSGTTYECELAVVKYTASSVASLTREKISSDTSTAAAAVAAAAQATADAAMPKAGGTFTGQVDTTAGSSSTAVFRRCQVNDAASNPVLTEALIFLRK